MSVIVILKTYVISRFYADDYKMNMNNVRLLSVNVDTE
jgi:hypothetical protein